MREEIDFTNAIEAYIDEPLLKLEPWKMAVDHLRLTITGKKDTPYEGGQYMFEIKFPENYPFNPPFCYAHTLIWHPNIDSKIPKTKINICLDLIDPNLVGKVDASTGASGWTPSKTLTNVVEALKGMIHVEMPYFNPGDPLNFEAGDQYLKDQKGFEKKARKWCKEYAM